MVLRVVFRLLLGGGYPGTVLLDLPAIPLPEWTTGITLLGAVTLESVLAGLYDGMRLASIVVCVGAANALANPKRLLRSVPPALYEVGAAMVVAVTVLPQLADSARRVRAAQGLRAGANGRVHGIRRFLVPVLEDAIDRSMAMAAGMDARGYGRAPGLDRRARVRTGALMIIGLCGTCLGTYAVLDRTAPRVLALPVLLLGVGLAVLGLVSAGRRVERTRYRPDSWLWPEWVVAGAGVLTAALWVSIARTQLTIAYPGLDVVPVVGLGVLVAVGHVGFHALDIAALFAFAGLLVVLALGLLVFAFALLLVLFRTLCLLGLIVLAGLLITVGRVLHIALGDQVQIA